MGHSSERVTERHYVGRVDEVVDGPFANEALMTGANVVPIARARAKVAK